MTCSFADGPLFSAERAGKMKIALFAAFPQEIAQIKRKTAAVRLRAKAPPFTLYSGSCAAHELIIVRTGMGVRNAEAAVEQVCNAYAPGCLVSIGFGGALRPGLSTGDLVIARSVSLLVAGAPGMPMIPMIKDTLQLPDAGGAVRCIARMLDASEGSIITIGERMTKAALAPHIPKDLPHPVCDMETYPLARYAVNKDIPFLAVRAVTDSAEEDIPPELFAVTDEQGVYRSSRALRRLLLNPRLIPCSIRMGRNARTASMQLWRAVQALSGMRQSYCEPGTAASGKSLR
ncbi:MAG: hypothetical protein AB1805_06055 [Nitrospirota bacterium]